MAGEAHDLGRALADEFEAIHRADPSVAPAGWLFSTDTWIGIVLHLRNLLINWLAFAPIFLLAVIATIFYRAVLWRIGRYETLYIGGRRCSAISIVDGWRRRLFRFRAAG